MKRRKSVFTSLESAPQTIRGPKLKRSVTVSTGESGEQVVHSGSSLDDGPPSPDGKPLRGVFALSFKSITAASAVGWGTPRLIKKKKKRKL